MPAQRDNVPRIHRIVEHAQDQLIGIASGNATFEDSRRRYGETQERLARMGIGRLTASRVAEEARNWAPTRDVLSELIRLGALEGQRLPSARRHLDAHRNNQYILTDFGRELAQAAKDDRSLFVDRLTTGLLGAHPYLRSLLLAVDEAPIVCPVVSEGDIERGRGDHRGTFGWGDWAAERIGQGIEGAEVAQIISRHLQRRFGAQPPEKPSNKAISEAMNDGLSVAGFAARGLAFDANTIRTLLRWGTDLMLFDQSRYVPQFTDANTIWIACDLQMSGDQVNTSRRGLGAHAEAVATALIDSYRDQASEKGSMLTAPYLPIFQVRAQAAFQTKTMRKLGDLVLAQMLDGEHVPQGVTVAAHIGTSQLPGSEAPFRHNGRRRLEMTVTTTTNARSTR